MVGLSLEVFYANMSNPWSYLTRIFYKIFFVISVLRKKTGGFKKENGPRFLQCKLTEFLNISTREAEDDNDGNCSLMFLCIINDFRYV